MSAEYEGKQDPTGLTTKIWPKPPKKVQHRIRNLNLSGDESGLLSYDETKSFWHGGDRFEGMARRAKVEAQMAYDEEIDRLWYD